MNKLKFRLVALALEVITIILVNGELMPIVSKTPDLDSITARIINSCYGERVGVIGLAGNLSDSFVVSFGSDDPMSTVLINNNEKSFENGLVSRWSRYKLQVFAVTATSSLDLERILLDVKNSQWWNHMAQFYIFDSSRKEDGCSGAFEFLWKAWTMNILGAKFTCKDDVGGALIYTFNPYTESAPKPWKLSESYKGINEHPWALFVRSYSDNVDICKNIDFDKTSDAGGYEVRYATSQGEMAVEGSKSNRFARAKSIDNVLQTMSRHMNISLKIMHYSEGDSLGFIDNEGEGHGMLADVTNGRADLISRYVLRQSIPDQPATYPIFYGKYFAVTQLTAYLSQWQKIISAIDASSRIGLCIVCLVTVIFLKYALKQSSMIAILNTLRMICNSCFTELPNNFGSRIYLACLFIFVVVMQALYQGQWAALMTKHIRYPNINNKRDLMNSDHVIYGRVNDSMVFSHPSFEKRFVGIDTDSKNCTDNILLNSSIACVSGRSKLLDHVVKLKLHMSEFPVIEFALSQPLRQDWPLEERLMRHEFYYVESGIREYDYEAVYAHQKRILDIKRYKENDDSPKVLTVKDLDFTVVILGVGWACAIISFFIELFFWSGHSSAAKNRTGGQRNIRR